MGCKRRLYWRRHIEVHLGGLPLIDVRPPQIRTVLDAAVANGLAKESVSHIRRLMSRIFKSAWRDEIIADNPVARVTMPPMREVRKERVILTDEEVSTFLGSAKVDLELRMLSLVARVEGGKRTGDLNKWDWAQIDRLHFEQCTIPRAKTSTPQVLEVPEALRPFLAQWWERQGKPTSGPVFPSRKGRNKGGFKARRISYAKRLRTGLFRAVSCGWLPFKCPPSRRG